MYDECLVALRLCHKIYKKLMEIEWIQWNDPVIGGGLGKVDDVQLNHDQTLKRNEELNRPMAVTLMRVC
jgi:hypothetical protein